jgi:hypothetical protein
VFSVPAQAAAAVKSNGGIPASVAGSATVHSSSNHEQDRAELLGGGAAGVTNRTEAAEPSSSQSAGQGLGKTKEVLSDNLEKAHERHEKWSNVEKHSEELAETSREFASTSKKLRQQLEAQNECSIA